jgi:hypothetical protein
MRPGTFTIELTVSDGLLWSESLPMMFTVTPAF